MYIVKRALTTFFCFKNRPTKWTKYFGRYAYRAVIEFLQVRYRSKNTFYNTIYLNIFSSIVREQNRRWGRTQEVRDDATVRLHAQLLTLVLTVKQDRNRDGVTTERGGFNRRAPRGASRNCITRAAVWLWNRYNLLNACAPKVNLFNYCKRGRASCSIQLVYTRVIGPLLR